MPVMHQPMLPNQGATILGSQPLYIQTAPMMQQSQQLQDNVHQQPQQLMQQLQQQQHQLGILSTAFENPVNSNFTVYRPGSSSQLPPEVSLSMFGDIPIQVSFILLVPQDLFSQSGFAHLARAGHEDHLPREVFLDFRRQVTFHVPSVMLFSTSVKKTREFF